MCFFKRQPPHRPWDCPINFIPSEPVPAAKIYPLTIPEQKTSLASFQVLFFYGRKKIMVCGPASITVLSIKSRKMLISSSSYPCCSQTTLEEPESSQISCPLLANLSTVLCHITLSSPFMSFKIHACGALGVPPRPHCSLHQ